MRTDEGKLEFEILGYTVTFRTESEKSSIRPEQILDLIQNEAELIKKDSPNLDSGQLAILLALKLAKENLDLKNSLKDNIENLQASALDALRYFEKLVPTKI